MQITDSFWSNFGRRASNNLPHPHQLHVIFVQMVGDRTDMIEKKEDQAGETAPNSGILFCFHRTQFQVWTTWPLGITGCGTEVPPVLRGLGVLVLPGPAGLKQNHIHRFWHWAKPPGWLRTMGVTPGPWAFAVVIVTLFPSAFLCISILSHTHARTRSLPHTLSYTYTHSTYIQSQTCPHTHTTHTHSHAYTVYRYLHTQPLTHIHTFTHSTDALKHSHSQPIHIHRHALKHTHTCNRYIYTQNLTDTSSHTYPIHTHTHNPHTLRYTHSTQHIHTHTYTYISCTHIHIYTHLIHIYSDTQTHAPQYTPHTFTPHNY